MQTKHLLLESNVTQRPGSEEKSGQTLQSGCACQGTSALPNSEHLPAQPQGTAPPPAAAARHHHYPRTGLLRIPWERAPVDTAAAHDPDLWPEALRPW